MPNRDTFRDRYGSPQDRWTRDQPSDAADHLDPDSYGWSSQGESRSFSGDAGGGRPQDHRSRYRNEADYGGQGAYGQGAGPGGYGYGYGGGGAGSPDRTRFSRGDDRTYDYDRGGQGGFGPGRQDQGRALSAREAWEQGAYAQAGYRPRWRPQPELSQDRSPREFYGQRDQRHEHDHDPHYSQWRASQMEAHDRDYADWREQQARRYDDDYGQWRGEKHEAFSKAFETWRSGRDQARQQPTELTVSPPEVENVSDGRKPSDDRNNN